MSSLFGKRLTKRQESLKSTLEFLVRLTIFSVPLYVILYSQGILMPMQLLVAGNVEFVLHIAGFGVAREGALLIVNNSHQFAFFISEDCTGWKTVLLLAALIFAVPRVKNNHRLIGLIAGIPLIYIGNLVRIYWVVAVEQVHGIEYAMLIHDIFWHAGLISIALAFWGVWFYYSKKKEKSFLSNVYKLFGFK